MANGTDFQIGSLAEIFSLSGSEYFIVDITGQGRYRKIKASNVGVAAPTLSTPTGFTIAVASSSQLNLSWSAVTNATSYLLERSLTGTGGWSTAYSGSGLFFNDTGLSSSTTYYYRLSALASGFTTSGYATANATTSASVPFLSFTTGSGTITQSPTGTWAGTSNAYMEATTSLAASTDGYIQTKIQGSAAEAYALGFDPTATQSNFPYPYYLFVYSGTYWWGDSSGGNNTAIAYATNDLMRLRRASGTLIGEKSSDGGATWTTIHTWAATSTAKLYCKVGYSGATSGTVAADVRGFNLS